MLDINSISNDVYALGGVNFYEDLHFSYFYLSESLDVNTNDIYPGYSEIIALYVDGVEKYYIKKAEAKNTAVWLIDKILSDTKWFKNILNQIEEYSKNLNNFAVDLNRNYTNAELLQLYELHFQLNIDLYKVARIPEALDRGEPHFTNYLKNHLTEKGFSPKEIPYVFNFLTSSNKLSIFGIEQQELSLLRKEILNQYPTIQSHYAPLMLLAPKYKKLLRSHTNKWSVLNYHGYRNPKLLIDADFFSRILLETNTNNNEFAMDSTDTFNISEIDDKHKMLFALYGEIGRIKILRRFYQLRNFYNLDKLLIKISEKLDVSELQLRYCLPSEIKSFISKNSLSTALKNRITRKCAIQYNDNTQNFFFDDDFNKIEQALRSNIQISVDKKYKGHCVSLGKVQGRAKKIDKFYNDLNGFRKGDIILCQSIDPDFLPFLSKAAGVVTEQGGVTSHASIICRELKIPTISGIPNLLELINDDDIIEVDAYNEVVKIISLNSMFRNEILVKNEVKTNIEIIGNKASNLFLASERDINVPHFHILSYDAVCDLFQNDREKLGSLIQSVCNDIEDSPEAKFILRSSCTLEDSPNHFYAGFFKSFYLDKERPIEAISNFINYNKGKGYSGSIILQKLIDAEYSGVCMLGDMNYKDSRHLVIEYSNGAINHATSGDIETNRIVYNVLSQELIEDEIVVNDKSYIIHSGIINWFKKIETKFSKPTYLEWGYKDNEFWLYQIRFKIK